jgi:hypothetical protein
MKPYVISRQTLENAMLDEGIPYVGFLFDSRYAVLPGTFVRSEKLASALRAERKAWGASTYKKGENDCDDFAFAAWEYVKGIHRRTKDRPAETSPAWGVFVYTPDSAPVDEAGKRAGHAINFALTGVPHNLIVRFYEIQTQQVITLTVKEKATCRLWLV